MLKNVCTILLLECVIGASVVKIVAQAGHQQGETLQPREAGVHAAPLNAKQKYSVNDGADV